MMTSLENIRLYKIHREYILLLAKNKLNPVYTARLIFLFCSVLYNMLSFFEGYSSSNITLIDNFPEYEGEKLCPCEEFYKILSQYTMAYISSQYLTVKKEIPYLCNSLSNKIGPAITIIKLYLDTRYNDNWNDNSPVELPNGSQFIELQTPQEINKWEKPDLWTPIRGQKPLAPNWGKVVGVLPTQVNDSLLNYFYDCIYPNVVHSVPIKKMAKEILEISEKLTDEQKMIAELWEGHILTPPGINYAILTSLFASFCVPFYKQVKTFLLLGITLFQTSKVCWTIKYNLWQARPIQTIRNHYSDKAIDIQYGKSNGNLWLAYQRINTNTPPFPDCTSGHSMFTSSFCQIMEKMYGKKIPSKVRILDDFVPLISKPLEANFKSNKPVYLNDIQILEKSSGICNLLPRREIHIKFNEWKDIAESSGISRVFGGIHYKQVNEASLMIGTLLGQEVYKVFGHL